MRVAATPRHAGPCEGAVLETPPRQHQAAAHPAQAVVDVRRHGDVLVVTALGRLDRSWLAAAQRVLLPAGGPVAVDLDECIVVDPEVLVDLHACVDAALGDLCVVSARPTCRRLLARSGVSAQIPVFARLEDALRAGRHLGAGATWRA